MTNKQSKKAKRPLQTSLGKAPGQGDKEDLDSSHLRKPINTNIYGLRQVLALLQTATDEVKDYILYECDVMYECRVCRTIFRSLANFILHKRNYCKMKFKPSSCRNENLLEKLYPPEPPENNYPTNSTLRGLTPVIEKLRDRQEIKQLTRELLLADLSNHEDRNEEEMVMSDSDLLLEEIATNNAAVFQTVLKSMPQRELGKTDFMKSEVMEIHGILDRDEVVLGTDGKICNFQTNKLRHNHKRDVVCTECNMRFSTKKTLTFHLKHKHNDSRLVYMCPDCKETFANAWCVYRHLYKVHRKTVAQVKKLRDQVHNGVIRKDQDIRKKNDKKEPSNTDKTDEENQWLNNIEGDKDFQMCGGCGKRFERKAALQSHATMCIKRIAVCNTIKENNAKKKEEESRDFKSKFGKPEKAASPENTENVLKGSSKRKPYLLRTYKQKPTTKLPNICNNFQVQSCDSTEKVCDNNVREQISDSSDSLDSDKLGTCDEVKKPNICNKQKKEDDSCDIVHKEGICDIDDKESNYDVKDSDERIKEVCDNSENSYDNDTRMVVKDCFCFTPPSNNEETSNVAGGLSNERVESIKELNSEKSHTGDFNFFYERVTERLLKIQDDPEKSSVDESRIKNEAESPRNETDFQSPGKISIRSLEELRGFPKEPELLEPVRQGFPKDPIKDETMPVLEPSVSPKTPKRRPRRLVKRKRTSSLDSSRSQKTFKGSDFDVLLDKQDLSFMSKVSPYMNRSTLTCKSCHLKHQSLSKLLWHMSAHFSWFRFQCSRCSFVSFGKSECSMHAKNVHEIKSSEISSVVLPIPNWKTSLMSSEFRELKNDDELGGKLTDEVRNIKPYCQTDIDFPESHENDTTNNLIDTLFVDTIDSTEIADLQSFSTPIKTECIDIADEQENFHQLEVPQEIYTLDVFEVINIDENEENRRSRIKEEVDEDQGSSNDVTNEVNSGLVNNRPIRNRLRSIKTLQDDFFYELSSAGGPKQRKGTSGGRREMRVYMKNK